MSESSDADTDDIIDALLPEVKEVEGTTASMKKPVQLDPQGEPFGEMKEAFVRDIQKYAKDLDVTVGWEGQSVKQRRRLLKRVYTGIE
jgi:hypothetical protein